MSLDLVSFENTYLQDRNTLKDTDPDAFACITIDGFPNSDDGEGRVVCQVWMTMNKDIIISWNDNGYRMNESVLALIEDSKDKLYAMWNTGHYSPTAVCQVTVYPCVEFDDRTAVICKYTGEHTGGLHDRLPQDVCQVAVEYYKQQGLKPVKAYPVSQAAYEAFMERHPEDKPNILSWNGDNATLTPASQTEQAYIAVIKASAVRDAQYAATADAPLEDDSVWYDIDDAEIYLGVYSGTEKTALDTAAEYSCTSPENIRLIPVTGLLKTK